MLTVDFREIPLAAGMRVLDAGCGTGRHLCEALRTAGVEAAGIDLKADDLAVAQGFLAATDGESGGRWLLARADLARMPFADGSFDAVVCSEVLEHVAEPPAVVEELVRVLKPGGALVVSVPRFWPERICWALSAAYHHEPGGHVRIYRKGELLTLLEGAGCRCRRVRYRHALHAPYWWLKCLVGHRNDAFPLVRAYRGVLEWGIVKRSRCLALLEGVLNPLLGKSIVLYLRKGRPGWH